MSLNKSESDQQVMRERIKHLTNQVKDVETALRVSEGAMKGADDKVEALKVEMARQQQMFESYKQQSNSKLRKVNLELQQKG